MTYAAKKKPYLGRFVSNENNSTEKMLDEVLPLTIKIPLYLGVFQPLSFA